jgi:hypothetical protein
MLNGTKRGSKMVGKSANESTPVANLTFEVNLILQTYVTNLVVPGPVCT